LSSAATRTDTPARRGARLRLVRGAAPARAQEQPHEKRLLAPGAAPTGPAAHVLVAGADANRRSSMLDDLHGLLPAGTRFLEAHETWEVIAHAATSRMVVLAGDLGDVSAESLVKVLGRRHPTLPVLAVGGETPTRAAADVDVAGV